MGATDQFYMTNWALWRSSCAAAFVFFYLSGRRLTYFLSALSEMTPVLVLVLLVIMIIIQLALSVVLLGHFFDGPDGSTKFHWNQTKIKGRYTSNVGMAQKDPKKWPLAQKRNFFGGGPNGKVVTPGIVVICPIEKNRNHFTKNVFWP